MNLNFPLSLTLQTAGMWQGDRCVTACLQNNQSIIAPALSFQHRAKHCNADVKKKEKHNRGVQL